MFKLVIFDFDGTLGDTRENIVITMQQSMRQLGLPVADENTCGSVIGLPLKDCYRHIYPHLDDAQAEACAEAYRQLFFANAKDLVPKPFPHVVETLQAIRDMGIPMSIASSRTSASLHRLVDDMGLRPYISFIVGSDEVARHKPDPEPVLVTLEHFGLTAAEALVVGDMPVDILMGRAASTRTCAVTYGNAPLADLQAAAPDHIISDLADLIPTALR
jgi:phosphoglycolate phosphatase